VNLLATVADKTHLAYAIHKAHNNGYDYVVECLAEVDRQYADVESVQKSAQRRREFLAKSGRKADSRLQRLWSNNDIAGIESLLQEEDLLNMGSWGTPEASSVVHCLAAERLVTPLRGVLTRDLIIQMEDKFEETKRISKFKRTWYCEHLLTTALKSEEPNMGMVKLLLDSMGESKMEWGQTSENDETLSYSDRQNWPSDILSLLIQAGHWWQIHEALPYLIQHGADLNVRQKQYLLTPLQVAVDINTESCSNHVTSAVRLLLDLGADPNVVAGWHQYLDSTALSLARDNAELVKLLIDRGAVPTTEDVRRAIEDGHEGALNLMLQHGADPDLITPKNTVRAPNSYNENLANLFPLHIAYKKASGSVDSREKYLSIVDLLLKHGADPLARYDAKSASMIHLLVQDGIYPSRLLESPDLDIEDTDGSGSTIFLAACKSPPPRRRRQQAGPDPDAEQDLVAVILDYGVDIRVRDNTGRNALHLLQHRPEITRRIAEEAPELVNQQDTEGNTPLFLHITSRNVAQINALLENGADVTLANNLGETPLHRIFGSSWHLNEDNSVMQDEHREVTMSLIKHGADVNARNAKNETPLFYFFRDGEVINYSDQHWKGRDWEPKSDEKEGEDEESQLSKHLVDLGVDFLPGSNSDGETLLHVVASCRYRGISSPGWFKLLLNKGHDLKEENKTHETPFDVAVKTRNGHLLELV
jgi:ankyrin repeat protein